MAAGQVDPNVRRSAIIAAPARRAPDQARRCHLRIHPYAHTARQGYLDHPVRVVHRTRWSRRRLRSRPCRRRRIGRHRHHFNTRELRHRLTADPKRSFQQMSPPRIEQATADAIPPRHCDRRYARLQALRRDLALLLDRLTPPPLAVRDHLDPRAAHAHTISRTNVLCVSCRLAPMCRPSPWTTRITPAQPHAMWANAPFDRNRAVRSTWPAAIGSPDSVGASIGGATKPMIGTAATVRASASSRAMPIAIEA